MSIKFPVLHLRLEPDDAGYSAGYRFMIEQMDGDRHFFRKRSGPHGSDKFLEIHGMQGVSDEDMELARNAMATAEMEEDEDEDLGDFDDDR